MIETPRTLVTAAAISLTSIAALGEPVDDPKTDQQLPAQVWVSNEVQCPLNPEKPWNKQLPYPPDPNGDHSVTEPEILSGWDRPDDRPLDPSSRETIVLEAVVNEHGKVERIGLLKGDRSDYTSALIESMKGLVFKPATVNGEPVCFLHILVSRPHVSPW